METFIANEFVTEATKNASSKMMQMIRDGKIRNHKLGNTASVHHGKLEEQELENYLQFLFTRNCYDVIHLYGWEKYGEY